MNLVGLAITVAVCLEVQMAQAAGSFSAPFVGVDLNGTPCVGNSQGYGPYDYTNPEHRGKNLSLVEGAHFTPNVEQIIKGEHGVQIDSDLDYTLRAFPNHHRALYTAIRYSLSGQASKSLPPPECWLNRARNFAPHDAKLPMLEGLYLHQRGRHQAAMEKYREAEARLDYKGELHYNMGLLSLDMGNYAEARTFADAARAEQYPLTGLDRKLSRLGY